MKSVVVTVLVVGLAGALSWLFPLFHIVRLDQPVSTSESSFDAQSFAEDFWTRRLPPVLESAPDAAAVLAAIRGDSSADRHQFGRKVGVSRTRLYLLRGTGTIVSIGDKTVGVALDQNSSTPDFLLHTGLLFGNAARDASGILNAADFPRSQSFNQISTELNRIIEQRVIAGLKEQAEIGRPIDFVGCAEIPDSKKSPVPLVLVPLRAEIR